MINCNVDIRYQKRLVAVASLNAVFHSSQKPTRKLAARTFIQSQYVKALAASLRVGFCDEWKRDLTLLPLGTVRRVYVLQHEFSIS